MLKALYDYGIRNGLALPPGFVPKPIRAYILLSGSGSYLGIEKCEGDTRACPDIGSLANSPDKCNPLAEKAAILLCAPAETAAGEPPAEKELQNAKKAKNNRVKQQFFHTMLQSAAQAELSLLPCLNALSSPEIFAAIRADAEALRLKEMDRIAFKVDDRPATDSPQIRAWWTEYRKQFSKTNPDAAKEEQTRCLITGEPTVPLSTVPVINGLQTVGGQASGESLFCFDKSAFRSYGLKQAANAPVSEEAFAAVKAALDDLLNGAPAMYQREPGSSFRPATPIYAGMKFVHWFDKSIQPKEDPIAPIFGFGADSDEEEDAEDELDPEMQHMLRKAEEADARGQADRLVESVRSGVKTAALPGQYHILLLSGASGRVMVRHYEHGSYEDLQNHLARWENDLSLCNDTGTGLIRPCKLTARLICLLSRQKGDRKPAERLKKELSGLTPAIVMAIINGSVLPDAVAVRALARIRAEMLDPDEKRTFGFIPNGVCCQWLKVWLLRKHRAQNEEVPLMPYYDSQFPNAAYHCGALVAIYADLQRTAMPDVNAGIVQRYYASASRTPTLVLGQLERLSKYHLAKLESPGLAHIYETRLNEAYTFFGQENTNHLPSALNLEDQSYFALGYRQMSARMIADRKAAAAKKAEQAVNQEEA